MGWFGFSGSRSRDDRPRTDALLLDEGYDGCNDKRCVYEAVRIDRAGKPSHLPVDRPRRRNCDERWDRR